MNISKNKLIVYYLLIPIFLVLSASMWSLANATEYYVRKDGNDTNCNGSVNAPSSSTPSCAFLTVAKSAIAAKTGDIVSIQAGTYNESINFGNSGTSSSPITFTGIGSPVIAGNIKTMGSYITIQNLTISPPSAGSPNYAVYLYGTYTIFNNIIITNYGATAGDQATAFGFDSGSSYNTLQNSSIINLNDIDAFHVFGHDQKILHNIVNNINTVNYALNHTDFIQSWGWAGSYAYNILVDSNIISNGTNQIGNLSNDSNTNGLHDWTFSNNIFANVTGALFAGIPKTYFYNNLFYQCGKDQGYAISIYEGGPYSSNGTIIINNAFVNNGGGIGSRAWIYNSNAPSVITISNNYYAGPNNAAITSGTGQIYGTNYINGGNPAFINAATLNFNIQSGSVLTGVGRDLSSLFTNDAAGNTRKVPWSIGPYQYPANLTLNPPTNLIMQ